MTLPDSPFVVPVFAVCTAAFVVCTIFVTIRQTLEARRVRKAAIPRYLNGRHVNQIDLQELRFLDLLQVIVGGYLHVTNRVRLDQLVSVNPALDKRRFAEATAALQLLHVDYVLYEPKDASVACVIQFDRLTSQNLNNRPVAVNVDSALRGTGIKVIHFDAQSSKMPLHLPATREEVKKVIIGAIGPLASRIKIPPPDGNASLYRLQSLAMTPREQTFHKALLEAVAGRYVIGFKVRLADIVELRRQGIDYKTNPDFHNIGMKHVDFVIVHPVYANYLLVIELDDESHQQPERIRRDNFVDRVFLDVKLPILHHDTNDEGYVVSKLRKVIDPILKSGKGYKTVLANGDVVDGSPRPGAPPPLFGDQFRKAWK